MRPKSGFTPVELGLQGDGGLNIVSSSNVQGGPGLGEGGTKGDTAGAGKKGLAFLAASSIIFST